MILACVTGRLRLQMSLGSLGERGWDLCVVVCPLRLEETRRRCALDTPEMTLGDIL